MSEVKFPSVKVQLVGQDGNVFSLLGIVTGAMRKAGIPKEEIQALQERVFGSHSYNEALCIMMETVNCTGEDDEEDWDDDDGWDTT